MFRKLFGNLQVDESTERDVAIAAWAATVPGVTLLRDAATRDVVKLAGIVDRLRVRPRDGVAAYEASMNDGTGRVRVIWLGRRSVPGLHLGVRLVVEGRLGEDEKGVRQLLNPAYEFEAAPGAH